ncbi:hypothetical protein TNCV_1090821 [Trichonephila clavipes]|uniref:Uncharacterized protein n=1 Tax=Trichonephila clavipes TaxID=2585209 RepID=A0A8X6STB9_TRICX|nr:hypothetical protein TNCV_1090821 [Trichonephila clavipes]
MDYYVPTYWSDREFDTHALHCGSSVALGLKPITRHKKCRSQVRNISRFGFRERNEKSFRPCEPKGTPFIHLIQPITSFHLLQSGKFTLSSAPFHLDSVLEILRS